MERVVWWHSVIHDGTAWHTVGVVGIVRELSTPSRRWHSDQKIFFRGSG